jgi:hypothetical protein
MSLNILLEATPLAMAVGAASAVWDTVREHLVKHRAKHLLQQYSDPKLKADLLCLREHGIDDAALRDIQVRLMRSLHGLDRSDQRRLEQGFSRRSRGANQRFAEDLLDVA